MGMKQFNQTQNTSLASLESDQKLKTLLITGSPLASRKPLIFTKNETPNKQEISKEARQILTKNMTLEYEFFEFIKERLKLQVTYLRKTMFLSTWCKDILQHINTK